MPLAVERKTIAGVEGYIASHNICSCYSAAHFLEAPIKSVIFTSVIFYALMHVQYHLPRYAVPPNRLGAIYMQTDLAFYL